MCGKSEGTGNTLAPGGFGGLGGFRPFPGGAQEHVTVETNMITINGLKNFRALFFIQGVIGNYKSGH